ncbi:MAG: nuclear transport factor 2 family protein [Acidobacteriota bacterium]
MHHLHLTFSFLLSVLLLVLVPAPSLLAQSKDERAVRALIDSFVQAGNSVDAMVVKRLLVEISRTGGPFYEPFGEAITSVTDLEATLVRRLQTLASRRFSPTTRLSVHMDRKTAWASFGWQMELTYRDGSQQPFNGRGTLIFAKEGKNWKLKHFHSSVAASPPPTKASLEADAKSILNQERAVLNAFRDKQLEVVAGALAENFSAFAHDQAYRIQGKDAYLGSVGDWMSQNELRTFQLLDPKVEVLGDTAVLTYYYSASGSLAGRGFSLSGKATALYVRKQGKWLALHHHNSVNMGRLAPTQAEPQ